MIILIPQTLNYSSCKRLLKDYYEASFTTRESCEFDWTNIEWLSLPEAIAVLSWSSRLVFQGTNVDWKFLDSAHDESLESARAVASHVLGDDYFLSITRVIQQMAKQARLHQLSTASFESTLKTIKDRAKKGLERLDINVKNWLDLELAPFRRLGPMSYLQRYQFFARAVESGINITPEPSEIPMLKIKPAPHTACLELQPVQSIVEVKNVVLQLNDPKELARVLGDYAGLDVARGGALSNIIVNELGSNIEHHAEASAGWLSTRLVIDENIQSQTESDPTLRKFRDVGTGFIEIIVCDNGKGLTQDLESVLARDKRKSVIDKYGVNGQPRIVQLVDYAFDRLSSTKRDIAQLVHYEEDESGPILVSSGLYWIWNLVRSHRGALSVRTDGLCIWYDFTEGLVKTKPSAWKLVYPLYEALGTRLCGTMVRICLPIANHSSAKKLAVTHAYDESSESVQLSNRTFSFMWLGALAEKVPLKRTPKRTRKKATNPTQRLPGMYDGHEIRLLQELERRHFPLKDGDVLVLDVCGARSKWAKHSVVALCQFVLEMNYTSTIGRSAVVIWNVPPSSEAVFRMATSSYEISTMAAKLGQLFERNLEDANKKHAHLREFRRAAMMIFDNDRVRIFCGWPEAEEILSRLSQEAELDLDEIGASSLEPREMERLKTLITENSHLFEWIDRNRVRLRIWPTAVKLAAWKQGISWFNEILGKGIEEGGVRLKPETGYFRLPSTGMLVEEFYQFRGLLANHQACAKLGWHVAQVVDAINDPKKFDVPGPVLLISISRSTMALAHHLRDNYYFDPEGPISAVLADRTVEELEGLGGNSSAYGYGILLTDVISSGSLCERIGRVFPHINWLASVALLDTRSDIVAEQSPLRNGIEILTTSRTATGPVYALAVRKVEKFNPAGLGEVQTTAIDEVNVCAVKSSDKRADTQENFWEFIRRKPDALKIGHWTGNNHHYIYNVDVGDLLTATKHDGESLLDVIVKRVSADLEKKRYEPDSTVIMHPPYEHSYAERIAKAVQLDSGALYRHVLYKDNFAGHWRFSPFVQHGVPLRKSTLVLIDDGTNTAETLMGLLDAASFGTPRHVLAYVGITRMPPHKNHLFTNIKSLKAVTNSVKLEFILGLSIPVYTPRDCPICRLIISLIDLAEGRGIISRYAKELAEELAAIGNKSDQKNSDFLWSYGSELSVAFLRESLETLDYHSPSSTHVDKSLKAATEPRQLEAGHTSLLDLAFIICAEPDLANATVLAPYLENAGQSLIEAALNAIEKCDLRELMTFVGCAFHLLVRSYQRSPNTDISPSLISFSQALLSRTELTTSVMGKIVSFLLAEANREKGLDPDGHKTVLCRMLLEEFRREVNPSRQGDKVIDDLALTRAFTYLFVREALTPLGMRQSITDTHAESSSNDFYDLATQVASMFWRHGSDYITKNIGVLEEALEVETPSTPDRLYIPIRSLILAFDHLYELQERIREIERQVNGETKEILGATEYWDSPELNQAIANVVEALVQIAEQTEQRYNEFDANDIRLALKNLTKCWNSLVSKLDDAFDEIFPEIEGLVGKQWGVLIEGLNIPESIAGAIKRDRVNHSDRVFISARLVKRFLNAAVQNLETSAFRGWSDQNLNTEARAYLELGRSSEETPHREIVLKVVDNGPTHEQVKQAGDGVGLGNVSVMAKYFAAELVYPVSSHGLTVVELRMRRRKARSERR